MNDSGMLTIILLRAVVALPVIAALVHLDGNPQPNETNLQRLGLAAVCSLVIAALATLWEASGGWPS